MIVALVISVIALGLSGAALYVSLSTRWARSRELPPHPLSIKIESGETMELKAGMSEWPDFAWRETYDRIKFLEPDGSLPGDPAFNVKFKGADRDA